MKKTGNNVRFLILLLLTFVVVNSCEPEDLTGKDIRDEITGQWTCSETINNQQTVGYKVSIAKSSDESKITISNFYDIRVQVSVTIEGRSLIIYSQKVDDFTFSGSGTVSSDYNTINLNYTVWDGAETTTLKATYRK